MLQRIEIYDLRLEQEILGAIICRSYLYEYAIEILTVDHFYDPWHKEIFRAMQILFSRSHAITPLSLSSILKKETSAEFFINLAKNVISPLPESVTAHSIQLKDLYIKRRLAIIGDQIHDEVQKADKSGNKCLDSIEQKIFNLVQSQVDNKNFVSLGQAVTCAAETANIARRNGKSITGITTGLADLDMHLGGLQKSDLIILAGRPGMGKTALGTCIAYNAAKAGCPTAFFSLEMSYEQLGNRMLGQFVKIPSHKLRLGHISKEDVEAITRSAQKIDAPFYIDDSAMLTLQSLRARARRIYKQYDLQLIVIDHLQLLTNAERMESRVQEISLITKHLKALAKDLNIPIITICQLSRAVEQREDKRPQLSDLRESGTIEQDADIVMFIYRKAYYLEQKKPKEEQFDKIEKWQQEMSDCYNIAEIIIAKQRHGPTGAVKLHYEPKWTAFSNLSIDQLKEEGDIYTID